MEYCILGSFIFIMGKFSFSLVMSDQGNVTFSIVLDLRDASLFIQVEKTVSHSRSRPVLLTSFRFRLYYKLKPCGGRNGLTCGKKPKVELKSCVGLHALPHVGIVFFDKGPTRFRTSLNVPFSWDVLGK